MKLHLMFSTIFLLAACTQQPGVAAPDTQDKAKGNEAGAPAVDNRGSATGTIQSIDTTTGRLTIAHGPVAALKWPAMTMAFKATPAQLASVHKGQKVQFEFLADGTGATITRISPE
jgi:Cu(I)/Ag(I) efflux system periplasmic protein CusF